MVDLSFLHPGPAGKDGFIRVQGGHLTNPDGTRIRFWGVHLTDWSPGSILLPPKDDIPMWASTLSRYGVNIVRLHFLDLQAPRGIIDATRNDTKSFDAAQLDRLDFLVSELKKRGIYVDLNLNVGRSYKAGDEVVDYEQLRWAKSVILFDPRLIELQKEYARQLLTHRNPYTGLEFREEPAVALVEIANENGIGVGFRAPSAYYDSEVTKLYNSWLAHNETPEALSAIRSAAGVADGADVPRLKASEVQAAPAIRFRAETEFFIDLQKRYFEEMGSYLRETLHVQSPLIGTADHNHAGSGYPLLVSLSSMDVLDGHVYWEHPEAPGPTDTPMVNDPLHSTVVQLSRTAVSGKPYTVSETNHPFPNEWASEGIPIVAAYGGLQDWDAIITYTFEPKKSANWPSYVGDPFDISLDPVRMTEFAAGALLFERHDVATARETAHRSYSLQQVIDSSRLPKSDAPYFTPGFPLALPLEHEVRIETLGANTPGSVPASTSEEPIASDTGELKWFTQPSSNGVVTVDTPKTEALIGFLHANPKTVEHLSADLSTPFATLILTSLDGEPIATASHMLLTTGSRVENTGMKWDAAHRKLDVQGTAPTLIEPVTGEINLTGLAEAASLQVLPLDGSGHPIGQATNGTKTARGWTVHIGDPVTTWYLVSITRGQS